MAGDSRQMMIVKRKMYSWIMSFLGDSNLECASSKQLVPDAKDVVGILKSAGFRLVDVTMGQIGAGAGNNALCCRVLVTCAKSGLQAVLESEADCRCPADALGNGASTWCVMSPTSSQESLDKSWNVTASSLMPNVPPAVAEVVGATTRFLVQLLEDKGLVAAATAAAAAASGRGSRSRRSSQDSTRTPGYSRVPPSAAQSSATDSPVSAGSKTPGKSQRVWLEDMEWEVALKGFATADPDLPEISGLSLSESQSFSRSETQLSQVGVIGPPRRQSSTLEDYGNTARRPADLEGKAVFDEHMRLIEQTRVLQSPSCALATVAAAAPSTVQTAIITTTSTLPPPPPPTPPAPVSADPPVAISAEVSAGVPSADAMILNRHAQTPTENVSSQQQANTAFLLPTQAQEALEQVEGFMQNMSKIMEMLKTWTMQVENAGVGCASTDPNIPSVVPAPPPTALHPPLPTVVHSPAPSAEAPRRVSPFASLASRATLTRKSAPAGGTKASVARSTQSRMPAASRAALRLRPPTPRPLATRVSAAVSTAERVVGARTTAKNRPQKAGWPTPSARPTSTSPALGTASSGVSSAGSQTMGTPPPPPPPPRRHSVDSPGNDVAPPVAVPSTLGTTRVVSSMAVAAGHQARRGPPSRTAPPPPPKPIKRPSK